MDNNTTTTDPVDAPSGVAAGWSGIQPKFEALRTELQTRLIERSTIIETSILALVSRLHHFQLGEPGVAKSHSVRSLVDLIDGLDGSDYFEVLLTRFSAPEEVFGPYDLNALEDSRFARNTDQMAPVAKFWFLDEVFKSNPSLLNAFLWALNERKFRNDGLVADLPLWSMFCASNELPEGEELNALYDRIHFRHKIKRIQEPGNFINMLKLQTVESKKVLTWEEVEIAAHEASQVEIPTDVLEALQRVRTDLRADGIEPTDRRFRECLKVIRAAAWIDGEGVADIEHLRPLAHMLWTTEDEIPRVERMLLELANPLDKEAIALLEVVDKLAEDLDKVLSDKDMDSTLRNKRGVELHNKVDKAKDDLARLMGMTEKSKRKSAKVEEVRQRLLSVTRRLLKEIFNLDVDEL